LHVATALALLAYFWRDWLRIIGGFGTSLRDRQVRTADQRLAWLIILATIPVGITGLLQSSTATALLVASFAGRGLIALSIALSVMLGANVGTTLTSQVLSFDLGWLSPLMIAVGVITFLSSEQDKAHHLGRVAIGLGLMLLSLRLLSLATDPLRTSPAFIATLESMQDEYVIAAILGTLATWFVHSSLSTVLLVMSFAASGIVSPPLALALVIGANVGGALAPYMAQSGSDVAARRVPLGNLITRLVTGVALLAVIGPAVHWLSFIDPSPARLTVNFHTAFSVIAAIVFLPLTEPLANLCLAHERSKAVLQHTGANPSQDVFAAVLLQHNRLDAAQVKQLGQKQP